MARFGRLSLLSVFNLTVLLLPPAAHAQRFMGFAAGMNVAQGPALPYQNISAGFAGQASLGYRLAPRLRVRFDALVSHFTASQVPVGHLALPTCLRCGGSSSSTAFAPTGPVGLTAVVANEIVDVLPPVDGGPGFYVIAGGGAYYVFQNPSAPTLLRFGLSGGGGLELPLGGSSKLVFEARYHGLINAPVDSRWLVPVTVGMRF